jgi:hypothetical protein
VYNGVVDEGEAVQTLFTQYGVEEVEEEPDDVQSISWLHATHVGPVVPPEILQLV